MNDDYKADSDDIQYSSSGFMNEEFEIDEQFWEKFWTGSVH